MLRAMLEELGEDAKEFCDLAKHNLKTLLLRGTTKSYRAAALVANLTFTFDALNALDHKQLKEARAEFEPFPECPCGRPDCFSKSSAKVAVVVLDAALRRKAEALRGFEFKRSRRAR